MSWNRVARTRRGKSCPTCGGTERYIANGACVACRRGLMRALKAVAASPKPKLRPAPNAIPSVTLARLMAGR